MTITLTNIGRRYNQEWIFRHIDYTFSVGGRYAILGPNGSGKSTLIKTLAGSLSPSEGQITYSTQAGVVELSDIYQRISMAAPYMELIEEFTLAEMLDFHFKFKQPTSNIIKEDLPALMGLEGALNKEIKNFSSGMKQRAKLVLACCSQGEIVFLDEPTNNLDVDGEQWYLDLIEKTMDQTRILIVGSNQPKEYGFCSHFIDIRDYKNF